VGSAGPQPTSLGSDALGAPGGVQDAERVGGHPIVAIPVDDFGLPG
jgi:hypothetical protein